MCGIIGISSNKKDLLEKGLAKLRHRGPDHEGLYSDENVVLGHRRLSIIDLSSGSNQPFVSEDGNFIIVFNGEIYNYAKLRSKLEQDGETFRSKGDTEVILKGFMRQGTRFFSKMRGMWALAIYDKKKSQITLSRDYFGIKPLYYGFKDGKILFASEIKALKQMGVGKEINRTAYYQFFNLGYFIAPNTQYADILKLRPGEIIAWDLLKDELHSEFLSPIMSEGETVSDKESAIRLIDEALRNSVDAHFVSDAPVGLLLSGGNDSSFIAAISKHLGKDPTAYHLSIHGSTDTYYADRVAKYLGIRYERIEMTKNALHEQYERLDSMLDEPTGDISLIPTSFIYSLIGRRIKVVLSGEGGDELFGGYLRHTQLSRHNRMASLNIPHYAYDFLASASGKTSLALINPTLGRMRTALLSRGIPNDVLWAYLQGVKIADFPVESRKIRKDMYNLWNELGSRFPSPSLFFDIAMYLPNDLMQKGDIASMASSIESRVPFLDKEFFKAVLRLHPNLRLSREYASKKLLKEAMLNYLPRELVYRDKKGFGFSLEAYKSSSFREDCVQAFDFHRRHADMFGIGPRLLEFIADSNCEIVLAKYPRFAFALITNWKLLSGDLK